MSQNAVMQVTGAGVGESVSGLRMGLRPGTVRAQICKADSLPQCRLGLM